MEFSYPSSTSPELPALDSSSTITGTEEFQYSLEDLYKPIGFDTYNLDNDNILESLKSPSIAQYASNSASHDDYIDQSHGANLADVNVLDCAAELDFHGQWPADFQPEQADTPHSEDGHAQSEGINTRILTAESSDLIAGLRGLSVDLDMMDDALTQDIGDPPVTERLFTQPTAKNTRILCTQFGLPLKGHSPDSLSSSSPPRELPLNTSLPPCPSQPLGSKCRVCGITTKRAGDMPRHMSSKHGPYKFRCTYQSCREKFHRTDKARKHCRDKHGEGHGENDFAAI